MSQLELKSNHMQSMTELMQIQESYKKVTHWLKYYCTISPRNVDDPSQLSITEQKKLKNDHTIEDDWIKVNSPLGTKVITKTKVKDIRAHQVYALKKTCQVIIKFNLFSNYIT